MVDVSQIQQEQARRYPGLHVRRDGEAVVVHIPAAFRKRNGQQTIIVGEDGRPIDPRPDAKPKDDRRVNRTLVEAIAKAHRWQEQLESGEYPSVDDLAQSLRVDRSYVSRLLQLTSLAPDLVEAILRGEEPDGLSLAKLRKNLPVRWDEQRREPD
ncbi:MAG: hypothetical protein GXY74_16250 [Phycisphaerae bacterium]|nr:hypothetical protein [Phycisphaerae bacterium]